MPDRSKRRPREDENEVAARILRQATEKDDAPDGADEEELRRQAARILGRRGGLKGGPARARKLSKKRRSEIAKKAARARWRNKKKSK
jgi:hypothetical protein